ncbi:hypothetical protein C0993_007657 [Termitomyces sp. T159_Od127]|nr:hypothetical protein C0993_007657 [Termitomyces sp. T159_Od127]
MYTPWINLLLASGATHSTTAVDKALNTTIYAVTASAQTVHITAAHTMSQWGFLHQDLADTMRDILRPIYDWCIDDTLLPSSIHISPFAAPTPPPSVFWNAEVRSSSVPSPLSIPKPLFNSSAAPLPKRVPSPTPASRPQPTVVINGWGRWRIAPPTATHVPLDSPADIFTPTSTHPRLGPVAMPRVASYQPPQSFSCQNIFIGPRLPTSPIGSFNGTELPVPGHTCSPDDRPPKPRYIWTGRPKCPFNSGDLSKYIVCPIPVGLSEHKSIFLDPPGDPRDPVIDLALVLDSIPLYFESIVVPNDWSFPSHQRTTSFRDSIWFKLCGAAFTSVFTYVLYLGLPVTTGHKSAIVNADEPIETIPPQCPSRRRLAATRTIEPQVSASDVNATRVGYFDTVVRTVDGYFFEITHIVLVLGNLLVRMAKNLAGAISLFLSLWQSARKVVQRVFVATSRVVLCTYGLARNIVKGSSQMGKDVFTYITTRQVSERPTSPIARVTSPTITRRRPARQSASPTVQSTSRSPPAPGSSSFDTRIQILPTTNSVNAQTTEQPEPSTSRSSDGLRSLPRGVADAIRAGNAPSLVRRAGKRRVNMARPLRTGASASSS